MKKIKLIAMDLDGTLTQHKTPPTDECMEALTALSKRYKLLMVGAGMCERIYRQLNGFPIDILGNYGMQYAEYDWEQGTISIVSNEAVPCDKENVARRIAELRQKYGFTDYRGESVEYHSSGCVTFPILGTKAKQEDKLAFDPDRQKRRKIYEDVKNTFHEYNVFIGGSSSFDMAPFPFDKAYALNKYCDARGISHDEVVFIGDDYGTGGNDESVYQSDFQFIMVDDYREFPKIAKKLLSESEI